ncbi:MAG: hypothetical protein ACREV3_11405 [Gammaproteobacteria bacterium]
MNTATPFILALVLCLASCTSGPPRSSLHGKFADIEISTTVDDPIASYYVESYLVGARRNRDWDAVLDEINARLADRIPTSQELSRLSHEHSTDLAALVMARQLLQQAERQPLYRMFREELSAVVSRQQSGEWKSLQIESDALFLFVPGWLYRTDTTTGADFAQFRALLASHGAHVALAQTGENASVEDNAEFIAAQIRGIAASRQQVVIVSASKGGPETALALSMLGDEAASKYVMVWVNIGGLLHGTQLADFGLTWPVCWFVQLAVLPDGSFEGIRSLSVAQSERRWQDFRVPEHLLVVNYLGIPLSGQISELARGGYSRLRANGPNDGLTFLTDAIAPTGVTIPEFGVDHFFLRPDVEAKTLALVGAITRYIKQRDAQHDAPADRPKAALLSVR